MIVECLVILGILAAMTVIFLRTRREHAVMTLPLMFLPAVHILAYLFFGRLAALLTVNGFMIYTGIVLGSLLISGVFVGVFSTRLKAKSNKITYVVTCMIFNLLFSMILIQNAYVSVQ